MSYVNDFARTIPGDISEREKKTQAFIHKHILLSQTVYSFTVQVKMYKNTFHIVEDLLIKKLTIYFVTVSRLSQ